MQPESEGQRYTDTYIYTRIACTYMQVVNAIRIWTASSVFPLKSLHRNKLHAFHLCSVSLSLCVSVSLCLCLSVSLSLYLCVLHALSLLLSRARTVSLSLPHSNTRVCAHSLAFHVSCCLSAEQPTLSYTHTNNNTTNFAFTFALPLSFLSDKKIWKTSTYSLVVKRHKEGVSNFKYEETIQEYVEFNCWCPARVQGK